LFGVAGHPALSQVIWKFISTLRCETVSQIVVPSRNPPAKIGDFRFIKVVYGKVFVREDADATEMVQDRFQIEVPLGRTVRRPAGHPAGLAGERQATPPGSPAGRGHKLPLPLLASVRTQEPPQARPHADQRFAVHEPLKILPLRLREQQRIQKEALAVITDVIHPPS
jgi:hypothetical protein